MKHYILLSVISAIGLISAAQDLHTEVTVDRTVQPVLRDAQKPNGVTPSVVSEKVDVKHLNSAEYTSASPITPDVSVLPAVAWPDAVEKTPYRGYASLGYLPIYNLGANLGYRLIDKKNFGLGLWAQYMGDSYYGDIPYYDEALFNNHYITVGGNAFVKVNRNSVLTADGRFNLANVRTPYYYINKGDKHWKSYNQGALGAEGHLKWSSRYGQMVYSLGGELGFFSLDQKMPDILKPKVMELRQAYGSGTVSLGLADDDTTVPWIGIDGKLEMLRSTNLPVANKYYESGYLTLNMYQGSFRPYMRFDGDGFEARIGLNITGAVNYISDKDYYAKKLRIFPDIYITWRPASIIALYASLAGDEHLNYVKDLFDKNHYMQPFNAYGRTRLPAVARGGINVGPYDGMSLSLFGGYARARDLLSPMIQIDRKGYMSSYFYASDTNSWYLGAKVGFAYHDIFDLSFTIATAGADTDYNTWYEWIDAPKVVADAEVNIHPIKPLTVSLSYNMRYDRKGRSIVYSYNDFEGIKYNGIPNLGGVNNVNLGARYALSEQISISLDVNNLLNQKYKLVSGMPAIGLNGLLGASLKF